MQAHLILHTILFFFLSISFSTNSCVDQSIEQPKPQYFVTVADTEHFPWLQSLIATILKYNYTKITKIAVFDLGLTEAEIETLNKIKFIDIHAIEDANPDMRKKFEVRTNGRLARGWYSWKPVVFHQALKMFPYFLYIDSGIEVTAPLDPIFDEIVQNGYYLFDTTHLIYPVVTEHVKNFFDLESSENRWILEEKCLSAGIQGISRSLQDSYVTPMYKLASEIKNFEDDGTAPWGYGFARHDQLLFSIFARKLELKTHPFYCNPSKLKVGDRKVYFGGLKYFKLKKHVEQKKENERLEHAKKYKLLG